MAMTLLDYVMVHGRNMNFLVLDAEDYTNIDSYASHFTVLSVIAKFAIGGKEMKIKDLCMMSIRYVL